MGFGSFHPFINFIYFFVTIIFVFCVNHPIYVLISYVGGFAFYSILKGKKGLVFNLVLIPFVILYVMIYASYNHFGVTVLWQNSIGNNMTKEAIVYGGVLGIKGVTLIILFACVLEVMSIDKVVYLLGRISPKLSLYVSILFRSVPLIGEREREVSLGRQGIGRGKSDGNILRRVKNILSVASIVTTATLDSYIDSSTSMKARGYSLKGRTAFSTYRFDNRDRLVLLVMTALIMITVVAAGLGYTKVLYDPEIIIENLGWLDVLFVLAYGGLVFLPTGLHTYLDKMYAQS